MMPELHLSRLELLDWRDEGAGDRDRIVGHLAGCTACRQVAAELERVRPPDQAPVRFDPSQFRDAGYRARRADVRAARWWIRPVPLAAAAALVLAAVIAPQFLGRDQPPEDALRGGAEAVVLIHPVGATVSREDLRFEWKVESRSNRTRLQVFDLANPSQPVLQRDVEGSRYAPGADERSRLQRGREYSWFIEFRGERGATEVSPAATFVIR